MPLLPRSLFGRLVLTFVCGLFITMAATLYVQSADREVFVFRVSAMRGAQRLADLVSLMEKLSPAERANVVEVARQQGTAIEIPAEAPKLHEADLATQAGAFRDMLAETLGRQREMQVAVRPAELPPETAGGSRRDAFEFDVSIRLDDGEWARFGFSEPRRLPRYPTRLIYSMLAFISAMVLLSFIAVRWVTRPLHELAEAADKFGTDLHQPPVREDGPLEVRQAARAFNAMQERLGRYVRTRTAILAAMSHDLKTPITRLRLRAEMLEQPDVREKFVRDLSEMERMVNTTLGYMRGLDDREPLRAIDVNSLVSALQADAEELGHKVQVSGQCAGPFCGKPDGLKRCLQNLLDNALRYGCDVSLEIVDAPDALIFYVRDRGPGIPPAELERVFEPFFRLEGSRNQGTGGTGLGLSIARNIAQSMGGDVQLRNRDGGGLEACLRLPRGKPPPSAQPESAHAVTRDEAGPRQPGAASSPLLD